PSTCPAQSGEHTRRLHDALPILAAETGKLRVGEEKRETLRRQLESMEVRESMLAHAASVEPLQKELGVYRQAMVDRPKLVDKLRSEEHTSELQSRENLVCRLLLE